MTQNEMRNLKHGQKIKGPDGTYCIDHNDRTVPGGKIVATRSVDIPYKAYRDWEKVRTFDIEIGPGTYEVTINKKID